MVGMGSLSLKALEHGKDANLLSAAEALVEVSLLSPSNSSSVAPRSFATSPSTSEAQKALETVLATTRAPELWTSPRTPASKADTIAVMLAMQRSGTNFLAVELSRHPCIDLQHELFNDLKLRQKLEAGVCPVFPPRFCRSHSCGSCECP